MTTYSIRAYRSLETENEGSDYETKADTLKRAKELARMMLSEEFRRSGEMSECFRYANVINEKNDECVFECHKR